MIGNTKQGFTLIEALVSAAVAGIMIVVVVGTFTVFQKLQNTSQKELGLQVIARQIINSITESTRTSFVDYDFYAGNPAAESQYLALRSTEGIQTVFEFYNPGTGINVYVCTDKPFDSTCAKGVNPSTHADWAKLNSNSAYFVAASFFVQPSSPQYYDTTTSDNPQLITIRMQLTNSATPASTSEVIQTTLTPRVYGR
jgi:prepilin-type N-terminal cleavage/methylation domain-containing protein